MNDNIKTKVVDLLESTRTRIRNIELLRYELQHRAKVSGNEMIDVLTFGHGDNESHAVGSGSISDKTMRVALDYERKTEEANKEIAREIANNLVRLEAEQERLEKYISLLDANGQVSLHLFYFEKKCWKETAEELGTSVRTAQRLLNKAVNELCDMYEFTGLA